ncbi:MAG: M6 family metalloprotease domain-containing protein [bacterium]
MKKLLLLFFGGVFFLNCATVLFAAPPNPLVYDTGPLPLGLQDQLKGPRKPVPQAYYSRRESVARIEYSTTGITATTGTAEVVVLLIEFTDVTHGSSYTSSYFNNLLFSTTDSESMYSYYQEVSYNQLDIDDGDGNPATNNSSNPTSWLTSAHSMSYYGEDSTFGIDDATGNIYELAQEAVQLADSSVDFSDYDTNGDGTVDHVIIVHAGPAQESGGGAYSTDAIWSHRWDIGAGSTNGYLTGDGVYVKGYTMQAESSPMGIFAHEFGHDLGLPDLYNTSSGASGVGYWSLMDAGSWGGSPAGSSPSHPSAWGKIYLAWCSPEVLNTTEADITVYPVETTQNNGNKSIYKIPIAAADDPTQEYYLLSYRLKTGFDSSLPGEGLLVWHIDDSVGSITQNDVNNDNNHRRVDLEGPSKTVQSDIGSAFGDGELFSYPKNTAYNGTDSSITVIDISGVGGASITASITAVEFVEPFAFTKVISYPNPSYDGNTTISFTITVPATTRSLSIYTLSGDLVKNVGKNDIISTSTSDNRVVYSYSWDGKNNDGKEVFSGIYLYLIKAGEQKKTGKLAIIK